MLAVAVFVVRSCAVQPAGSVSVGSRGTLRPGPSAGCAAVAVRGAPVAVANGPAS
jgi:hypothetical protein